MLDLDSYLRLREPPLRAPVMYQRWRSLLFLHFSCEAEALRPLIPSRLEIDTFEGRAWVGLVPFRMEGIRPRFLPGVPTAIAFPETNVRTYVHCNGEPGVWFFSLDAASPLACSVARTVWRLPYHEALMSVQESQAVRSYTCRRQKGWVESRASALPKGDVRIATPGSLEFFLVERYLLFAQRGGRLLKGRVHHLPYPIQDAELLSLDDRLVEAAGIEPRPIENALYSPGVDVRVFPVEQVY